MARSPPTCGPDRRRPRIERSYTQQRVSWQLLEAAFGKVYGVVTLPYMQTGASDMTFLRAKGMQCYGVGPMTDDEDGAKGFGQHSDQERILEEALYKHVQFFWEAVTAIAGAGN